MAFATEIRVPYKWSTGDTYGRFLSGLREGELWGTKCDTCDAVQVPPAAACRRCDSGEQTWTTVEPRGTLLAATTVEETFPGGPDVPFALGLVALEGGAQLLHRVRVADVDRIGQQVAAVWRQERTGSILDIEHFAADAP